MNGVLVFDLDDTLYRERDYVRSGFAAVSGHLAKRGVTDGFLPVAWSMFEGGARGRVFDEALEALGVEPDPALIDELVQVYRGHAPDIALCPDAERLLRRLRGTGPLALITDGPVSSQSAKIEALALRDIFDLLVLTDEWGIEFRKPHERAFRLVEDHWPDVPSGAFAYIADNPLKDFLIPRARGWRTVRIARDGGEHCHRPMDGEYAADETICSLDDLILPL